MLRILLIITGAFFVVTGVVWLTWYLAFGLPSGMPSRVNAPQLAHEVEIEWSREGGVHISARSLDDGLSGLGFAQTWRHAWHMALLRQAATGRLGEWFGEPAVHLDELVRWLNLPEGAAEAFEALGEREQDLIAAFSAGINAALNRRAIRHTDEFVLLRVSPDPWEPWHTIAVERLIAWLATPEELVPDAAGIDYHTRDFLDRRRSLQDWLHLHGFENSSIISSSTGDGDILSISQVYGLTTLNLFQEAEVRFGETIFRGVSLIGTPYFVLGSAGPLQWAALLTSSARLSPLPRGTQWPDKQHARTHLADGRERVTSYRRAAGMLLLAEPVYDVPLPDAPPRRAFEWAGMEPVSDASVWLGFLQNRADVNFRLMDGLAAVRSGNAETLYGAAEYRHAFGRGTVLSPSPEVRTFTAARLDALAADEIDGPLVHVMDDVTSLWAAGQAPAMIAAIDTMPRIPHHVAEALMYLRNWDFRFDEASIGASIFDVWYERYVGAASHAASYESQRQLAPADAIRAGETLLAALSRLEEDHGSDRGLWRWEEVQPNKRYYPIFSDPSAPVDGSRRLIDTRYAPLRGFAAGHPTTIRYGPAVRRHGRPAPSVYRAWIHDADNARLTIHADDFYHRGFLGRYLLEGRASERTLPASSERLARTVLTPR